MTYCWVLKLKYVFHHFMKNVWNFLPEGEMWTRDKFYFKWNPYFVLRMTWPFSSLVEDISFLSFITGGRATEVSSRPACSFTNSKYYSLNSSIDRHWPVFILMFYCTIYITFCISCYSQKSPLIQGISLLKPSPMSSAQLSLETALNMKIWSFWS